MAKELFISSTPHETKVAVVEDEQLTEIYFERENEYTLAGSIYKGRVTRVLPGMQSAFVDIGLDRDAFLYVTDFLEEQEDQEEFEQVVNRAHSDAHQPARLQPQSIAALDSEEPVAESEEGHTEVEQDSNPAAQPFDRAPRRWRGRRGRRRRGGFQDQTAVQGGPASSHSPEQTAEDHTDAAVLPGESLSKYRQVEATEEQQPHQPVGKFDREERNAPPRPPSESLEESRGVRPQGSESSASMSVLPGESISKYRNRGAQVNESEPTPPPSTAPQERPFNRGGSRWERPNRRPERDRWEAPQSGPPVVALPGESLAKYRRKEGVAPDVHAQSRAEHAEDAPAVQSSGIAESPSTDVRDHQQPASASWPQPGREVGGAVVHHSQPEQSDAKERLELEDVPGSAGSFSPQVTDAYQSDEEREGESVPHEFGSGLIEEEVIEEEESDAPALGEHLDEDIYEELEEETLDAENAEQLVEAVREAHVIQRLGLREGEPSDLEDHPAGEEAESFVPENESPEQIEAAGQEDSGEDAADEGAVQDEGEPYEEGRAELRAPGGTAGFQQRVERPERSPQDRFRRGRGRRPVRGRRNIQRESQPTISDLLKEGQEILVQIAKEPMAKKGARITSHIALPGRFLVYMPTVNHVGVSRKIGSDDERQRLKRVLISEKGNAHGGFIVRTAAAGASEEDLRSDLRFLINLWNDIKSRSENSKAPALIYHDLNLVERILRDQVTSNFSSIWMDSELEYERIVRFLGRFSPAMVRRAKLYTKDTPLFEQFGIQEEINNALKSKVWLKSGGYIVINQTEALVAIDINTGKYVGKTQRLEDTIVKTNIDAIREIVRQIRLRDLGGIIVIDFIDMDERRNRQKVMQALEEELKHDRAPSKVLQFNDFGLVAITRKRVKQSLERTLSTSCVYCSGTGMIKSVQTVCNEIYVEMRKMSKHLERHDVMLRVNPEVVKALKANGARWLQEMEELTGKTIIVKSDPLLHQEQFDIN
jgi:Rne/Rng family ribonuclease